MSAHPERPLRSILRGSKKAPPENSEAPVPAVDVGEAHRRQSDSPSIHNWGDLNEPGNQAAVASFVACVLITLAVLVSAAYFYVSGDAGEREASPATDPVDAIDTNATEAAATAIPQRRVGEVTGSNEDDSAGSYTEEATTWDNDPHVSAYET
ncbi:hypothetical protein V5799_020159 [Amblyomma americanum]|uniref:Uncharacterized protein n=1 Tax=Amblyomma americanum TaxID=6943 RepID=A0AAQ4EUU7_AMBAM